MNYPIWELPASGLLIAFVGIVHVFVSHFAVGGGLFLVVTERKARRENDAAMLEYVRRHSRFFVLLTLVFGAITGVGIWFTIGLVHPAATSWLINAFVWGWAIEWVFFFTEIAAAMVYYYGWDRLTTRQHLAVGWIYFGAAWASLAIINGILTFMMTPGAWIETHSFWAGFFNPTYWPALVLRTLGAVGLAGIYALFTASWLAEPGLRLRIARYAA
ncbi:MAG TPA: cytochrome ubiquinol oxidase subunit I, partial [Thermoanaerobaculia bacterium]